MSHGWSLYSHAFPCVSHGSLEDMCCGGERPQQVAAPCSQQVFSCSNHVAVKREARECVSASVSRFHNRAFCHLQPVCQPRPGWWWARPCSVSVWVSSSTRTNEVRGHSCKARRDQLLLHREKAGQTIFLTLAQGRAWKR